MNKESQIKKQRMGAKQKATQNRLVAMAMTAVLESKTVVISILFS